MLLIASNFEGKGCPLCPPFPPNSFTQFLHELHPYLVFVYPTVFFTSKMVH
jgi:hypothetical protein